MQSRANPKTERWWICSLRGMVPLRGAGMDDVRLELHRLLEDARFEAGFRDGQTQDLALNLLRESYADD
jgi:hypothetical protein